MSKWNVEFPGYFIESIYVVWTKLHKSLNQDDNGRILFSTIHNIRMADPVCRINDVIKEYKNLFGEGQIAFSDDLDTAQEDLKVS